MDELAVGHRALVQAIRGTDTVAMRLMEMGLTPGVEVAVVGVAPFGDPIELEIRGYHLCLRRREAERIQVERMIDSAD